MAYVFNPITGKLDDAGTPTTDASLLTSGTLADARLSSNVPQKNTANTFTSDQTFSGTANTAPSQTAASASSLMTRDLSDTRYIRETVVYRATSNSVTNTTTFVQDTTLTISSLAAGVYLVEAQVLYQSTGTGSGIKVGFYFTGNLATWTPNGGGPGWATYLRYNGSSTSTYPDQYGTVAIGSANTYASTTANTNRDGVWILTGIMRPSTSGNFYFQFAQNTASAVTTYIAPGSFIRIRQLA